MGSSYQGVARAAFTSCRAAAGRPTTALVWEIWARAATDMVATWRVVRWVDGETEGERRCSFRMRAIALFASEAAGFPSRELGAEPGCDAGHDEYRHTEITDAILLDNMRIYCVVNASFIIILPHAQTSKIDGHRSRSQVTAVDE